MKSLIFQAFSSPCYKKIFSFLRLAAISTVAMVTMSLKTGSLSEDAAKSLLGGDIEISQWQKPIPMKATSLFLFQGAELSRIFEVETEATYDSKKTHLTLKSVDRTYPLYGRLELENVQRKNIFTRIPHRSMYGTAVNQALLDALGIKLGQRFQVGKTTLVAEGLIIDEPDQADETAPRAIVGYEALFATNLLKSDAKALYRYRLKLPPSTKLDTFRQELSAHFPSAKWQVTDWRE